MNDEKERYRFVVTFFLLTIKKGKMSNIANAKSLVSQWNPVGGEVWNNRFTGPNSKLSCGTLPKIDAHFEYREIGIRKALNDSNKAINSSIINITERALNKVSNRSIEVTKNIIDNDNADPQKR